MLLCIEHNSQGRHFLLILDENFNKTSGLRLMENFDFKSQFPILKFELCDPVILVPFLSRDFSKLAFLKLFHDSCFVESTGLVESGVAARVLSLCASLQYRRLE